MTPGEWAIGIAIAVLGGAAYLFREWLIKKLLRK
jgi:hypothetical protein